jgi:hypothetical protein
LVDAARLDYIDDVGIALLFDLTRRERTLGAEVRVGSLTVLENVRFPLDQFTELGLVERNLTARLLLRQVEIGRAESLMPA